MNALRLTMGAALIAGLSLSGVSQADLNETVNDWKSYTGAFCQGRSSSTDVRRGGSGTLANWQAQPTTVYCPVVRDIAKGGNNRIKLVRINLFNNHATQGGYCRLVSLNQQGSIIAWDQYNWSPGIKTVVAELGPLNAHNWGSYNIYCRLPGTYANGARKSFIRNVRVDESK